MKPMPCPFCGDAIPEGLHGFEEVGYPKRWAVRCTGCLAQGPACSGPFGIKGTYEERLAHHQAKCREFAVESWNTAWAESHGRSTYNADQVITMILDAYGCGYTVGQKPYGEQFPGAAEQAWKEFQELGRKLGAIVKDHEVLNPYA